MLYHLSKNPYLTELTAQVPDVYSASMEDTTIPRVCFAPSINCCLRGLQLVPGHWQSSNRYPNTHNPYNEWEIDNPDGTFQDEKIFCGLHARDYEELHRGYWDADDGSAIESEEYPVYYVYTPVGVHYKEIIVPTKKLVYDVRHTHEVWLSRNCQVKKIAAIVVTGAMVIDKIGFFYNLPTGRKKKSQYTVYDYVFQTIKL